MNETIAQNKISLLPLGTAAVMGSSSSEEQQAAEKPTADLLSPISFASSEASIVFIV